MNTADAFAQFLEKSGHKTIFGYPGESTLPFYAAIKENTKIKHVMPRCEKCAGYAADAYARVANVLGFVDSPVGIGTPLLAPALNEAYNSSIPLFVFTSGIPFSKIEKWPTSHIDHTGFFKPFVKKTFRLEKQNRLVDACAHLSRLALAGRPGPVHLEIPLDVLEEEYNQNLELDFTEYIASKQFPSAPRDEDILITIKELEKAEFPVILVGGGIHLSNAYHSLARFAEKTGIPVATTLTGKGAIAESHPLALGVVGSKGTKFANKIISQSDLILIFGSKLGDKATSAYTLFSKKQKIIRFDIAPEELSRFDYTFYNVCADSNQALQKLANAYKKPRHKTDLTKTRQELDAYLSEYDSPKLSVSPRLILKEINRQTKNQILCADASVSCGWAGAFYSSSKPGRTFLAPRGTGSIGYALPATIGAKEAKPHEKVIGFGGDSGLLMSIHEMETVKRLNQDNAFILLNDNDVGLLTKFMNEIYGKKKILPIFSNPDYEKISSGFGWDSITVTRNSEVPDAIKAAYESDEPILINARIGAKPYAPDFENTLSRRKAN